MDEITVLIADYHSDYALFLTKNIEREGGIKVVGYAPNGQQAIDMARGLQPDVVILDIMLPDKGGLAVIRSIHAQPLVYRSQILVISSFMTKEIQQ